MVPSFYWLFVVLRGVTWALGILFLRGSPVQKPGFNWCSQGSLVFTGSHGGSLGRIVEMVTIVCNIHHDLRDSMRICCPCAMPECTSCATAWPYFLLTLLY